MMDSEWYRWCRGVVGVLTLASVVACGGGGGSPAASAQLPSDGGSTDSASVVPSSAAILGLTDCLPSGRGNDYQVGPQSGQLASLADVPWDALGPGDTVRIFYRPEPYRGKFILSASGTADLPVRVCGVKSPAGLRPVIDGNNAVTRLGLDYGDSVSTSYLHQTRSVIVIKKRGLQAWQAYPTYIQVDGLDVTGAKPGNTFTDTQGTVRPYVAFGACVWIDRGQHITIADNVLHDCSQGLYSKSLEDGDFAVTKDIRVSGNSIYGNGIVGDDHMHNTYMESAGIIYEFNHYGPLRVGALGNALKDRSTGTVIRYNRLEGGAHSLDLVEAEDFPTAATADPAYRTTLVYGNQIIKVADTGSTIHYGGDHYGALPTDGWGEPIYRRGTLYFYNNTVRLTGTGGYSRLFQISTTLEKLEAWNNVFTFDAGLTLPALRITQDVNTTYWTSGGTVNLGSNWINANWVDSDEWHPVGGALTGASNLITGALSPVDANTLLPVTGSAVIGAAQTQFSSAVAAVLASHPVAYQLDDQFAAVSRSTVRNLGALER